MHRTVGVMCVVTLVVSVFLTPTPRADQPEPDRLQAPVGPIPATMFGMHIHRLASTTPWPTVPFGAWRLWDAYVAWPNLEPQQGKWDFTALDKYVDAAEQHHVDVLLPLGLSPLWASSRPAEKSGYGPGNAAPPVRLDDWQNYVRTVATRYKGRIHAYEIWNEPNLKQFYSGSIPEMLQLASVVYGTLKQIDPAILVCSPSATGNDGVNWLDRYLQAGGGKYADVIGYHFYVNPEPPERMAPLIQQVKAVLEKNGAGNKPLWNTETGWAIRNNQSVVESAPGKGFNSIVLSEEQASGYLARTYILSWAENVSRVYWYAWDNRVMGLTEADGKQVKVPAQAYSTVRDWLVGARMKSCQWDEAGTRTCGITRDRGYRGWIVWNPDRSLNFPIPGDWRVLSARGLNGDARTLLKDQHIQIGPAPILVENAVQ